MVNSEIYYNQLQKKYSRSITLGLSRVKKALALLDNPHLKLKNPINIIGSTENLRLESISSFIEADKKTTTKFISPHLVNLQSRMWLKNRLLHLMKLKYENKISRLKIKLSLFEVLTLIYLLAASKEKADYQCVEADYYSRRPNTLMEKTTITSLY